MVVTRKEKVFRARETRAGLILRDSQTMGEVRFGHES